MSGYLIKSAISAGGIANTALEGASWMPGWVGSAANVGLAAKNFASGNYVQGGLDTLNAGLGLVGMNTAGMAAERVGGKLLKWFPKSWASKGLSTAGQGLQSASQWMGKTPGFKTIGEAFGPTKNWTKPALPGASRIGTMARNGVRETVRGNIRDGAEGLVKAPFGNMGNVQQQRIQAGQAAEQGWNQLNTFTNGVSARYGAGDPGAIGPHNPGLTSGPGYEPMGYPLYNRNI